MVVADIDQEAEDTAAVAITIAPEALVAADTRAEGSTTFKSLDSHLGASSRLHSHILSWSLWRMW